MAIDLLAPTDPQPPNGDDKPAAMLGLLNAVHNNSAVTQRSLAKELGVALGIANAMLRRCVEKGLIKVRQAPARRYAYYLTPRGFAEKSHLTAQYLTESFKFFRVARSECEALFAECAARGWRRLVLVGTGELAEIARLCVAESPVELVAVVDPYYQAQSFAGLPVLAEIGSLPPGAFDAVVVTAVRAPQAAFDAALVAARAMNMAPERVLAPKLLRVSAAPPAELGSDEASA
jgi:DNA-binding MarR family transcriptional regulator